jgi:hypothetical protein
MGIAKSAVLVQITEPVQPSCGFKKKQTGRQEKAAGENTQ